ncbi:MAG TPA: potassium/proton antiporter, partial [Candidatus Elarobacter sp.]|nr:potassium/proton antiporter [Candidatus Elarobacter sp.]
VVALLLIIFDGGLNTPFASLRGVSAPAAALATVGVVVTAAIVALAAHLVGLSWTHAWLLGAIVSPTDAAAVFSALRGSGLTLRERVGRTLEAESGANDPVAVILTLALTTYALWGVPHGRTAPVWTLPVTAFREILIGAVVGGAVGLLGKRIVERVRLDSGGLYPVLTIALALAAYGVPTLVGGSGFLGVYVAAIVLASAELPYRVGVLRVHDALAWLAQIGMFLVLGLLVAPSHLSEAAETGIVIALALTLVARPVAVALCVAPFGYSFRETLFLSIVGLRGAVPIVLATIPVIAGVTGAKALFDVVFFIVIVNTLLPGAAVPWLARRLGMLTATPPEAIATLVVESSEPVRGTLRSYFIHESLPVCGATLAEIPFPEGSAATMIVRGAALLVADGPARLRAGDHVYVLARADAVPMVHLLFGRP